VTTKRVSIEFTHICHQFAAQRIEMDIANQLLKIGVFLANYRLILVLKKLPAATMPAVEINGVTGQQSAHQAGDTAAAAAQ